MSIVVSDIVRYRARSVISRYLHQRGEPKDTFAPAVSVGVQETPTATAATASTEARPRTSLSSAEQSDLPSRSKGVTNSATRSRFPPLPDDYDIHSLNVFDLLDYLSELSFSRDLKLATARCYRRWLAAYLEDESHVDAMCVRNWVIPHSPDYYEMLLIAAEQLESEKEALAVELVKPLVT